MSKQNEILFEVIFKRKNSAKKEKKNSVIWFMILLFHFLKEECSNELCFYITLLNVSWAMQKCTGRSSGPKRLLAQNTSIN